MQTYMRLYYETGTGNYYSLDGEEKTLRGLFLLQSIDKEVKKIKNAYWKTICPVSCSVDSRLNLRQALSIST